MIIIRKFLIVLFLCLAGEASFAASALVKYIIDGDTFVGDVLLENGTSIKSVSIRLRNVDTPEIHGLCDFEINRAKDAKQRLSELIPVDTKVEIKNIKNDKYDGRIDADVFDTKGRDVGLILIKEKLGRPYSGGKRASWCDGKK